MMLWKCPSFSLEKKRSGIHTLLASVNVRYLILPIKNTSVRWKVQHFDTHIANIRLLHEFNDNWLNILFHWYSPTDLSIHKVNDHNVDDSPWLQTSNYLYGYVIHLILHHVLSCLGWWVLVCCETSSCSVLSAGNTCVWHFCDGW